MCPKSGVDEKSTVEDEGQAGGECIDGHSLVELAVVCADGTNSTNQANLDQVPFCLSGLAIVQK